MALIEAKIGDKCIVEGIERGHTLKKKLLDLGLTPGTEFRVINKRLNGPVIIEVRGTRLVLGRGIAKKISIGIG